MGVPEVGMHVAAGSATQINLAFMEGTVFIGVIEMITLA